MLTSEGKAAVVRVGGGEGAKNAVVLVIIVDNPANIML